jgi:hypothetical protein
MPADNVEYDENIVKETNSENTSYKRATFGLLSSKLVDYNKKIMNNIFKNTNISSILHYYTNHMKMVIEPFDYISVYDLFIVPPIEGIAKLIKYLNESSSFYNSSYRYFMDFSKTYLLSTKGNPIDIKDGTYSTIKLDIKNSTDADVTAKGLRKDLNSKIYIIEIDASDFAITKNKITEKKFNKLYGVDSEGNNSSIELNINNEKESSVKTKIVRLYNNNLKYMKSLSDQIESTSALITLVKGELDLSLIVPYKEYRISNISQYKDLDGKYLLAHKIEYIVQGDGDFLCSSQMSFKKIP